MLQYQFDHVLDRRTSMAEKWKGIPSDAIAMSIADMDFPLVPEVAQAIKLAADQGESGYVGLLESDYQAVIDWVQQRNGYRIPREHLIATPGVLYAARTAMYALTEPGDSVIVQPPLHTPSMASAAMLGRIPVMNWLKYENGNYYMDFDHLEDCFRKGAKVLMMCSPHNPTGRVWTEAELLQVAQILERYDGWLICDEIHRDILWDNHVHISPTQIPELADRSVSVFSTSKSFNMGGFHIGSAVIPNDTLRQKIVDQFYAYGHVCNRPALMCARAQTAAYRQGGEWFTQMMAYVRSNFDLALEYLKDTPIRATQPEGTFLLWADITQLGLDAEGLREVMYHKWKVIADPGSYYDTTEYMTYCGPEHHMRLNLATSRQNVEQAMERIVRSFCSVK